MFISKTNNAFFLRRAHKEIALCLFVVFPLAYLLPHGYLIQLTALCLFGFCCLLAYRIPLLTVLTLIVLAIFPTIFHMVPGFSYSWMKLAGGIRIPDVVMVSMLGAVLTKLFFSTKKKITQNKLGLLLFISFFGLWLLFEIARNVGMYGLSAPGEFRFSYLILSIPIYVCIFFDQEAKRKSLFKLLIVSALFVPILCIPIIGHLKGWSVGGSSRFFPSAISLGLLYGIIGLNLGKKYNLIRINGVLFWPIFFSAGLLILFDSHRSVWLVVMVSTFILFIMKEISYKNVMPWLLLVIISGCIMYAVAAAFILSSTGQTPVDFIFERSRDIVKFSEGYNTTAAWRVMQWKMQMSKFYASPIVGEGFGGYWGMSGKKWDLGVSPHSLYVQTLVKLGVVGMFLYLVIILKIFNKLRHTIARNKMKKDSEIAILITGLIVLIGTHVFYTVYAFEYYSLLFLGLSAAALKDGKFVTVS